MKKFLFLLVLSLSLCGITTVQAQSGCELYINTDFDSECLITDYIKCSPALWELGLQDCMLACKGNTVKYTAECPNASQYSWVIAGASSYYFINQGKTAVVTWDYGTTGNISVSVVVGDTNTCTAETCVLLMDSPEALSSSVPAYFYQDGKKVIEICLGETIEFTDMSTTPHTPITGYYWESMFGAASTQNHTVTPLDEGEYELVHCVRNECGCENCETYIIKVKSKVELELSCYGTVCEQTTANYTLINPPCDEYIWNVEGGSLEGQGTPNITVHWGSPTSGYGVISLDASKCKTECDGLLSVQIPVITSNAEISGPEVVCVGEMQIYELPRWGSTQYTWWNDNSTCLNVHNSETPNQYMLEFTHPGVVTIRANYICTFLNCGYLLSAPKTIIVKDTMSIISDNNTLCKGSIGVFYTTHTNPVQWSVYNQNNQQIYSTNAVSLSYTFTSAGKFKITASHNDYCKVVEYYVTVLDNPPALTSTIGEHVACLNSSILLNATPTHPRYYIVWEPVCSSANPTSAEGNEVTITYGNEVCNVLVYQVDNEYNCRSEAYIHVVDTFHLLPHGLPAITTTCAGSTVCFSVPDQSPDVTYEWTITPANAASIDSSDHLRPSICILTNHISNVNPPYLVNVILKRTYCSNIEVFDTVQLLIEDVIAPTLQYLDTVCRGDLISFSAIGGTLNSSHYSWHFDDTTHVFHGASFNRTFHTTGQVHFDLTYQPNPNCDAVTVSGELYVKSRPTVVITRSNNTLSVAQYINVSYSWTHNGIVVGNSASYTDNNMSGTYCCTVAYQDPPFCGATDCYTVPTPTVDTCLDMDVSISKICNRVDAVVTNPSGVQVDWDISTDALNSNITATSDNTATAYFYVAGTHYIYTSAVIGGQCYNHSEPVVIDCVPDVELTYDCNEHIVVKDISQYRDGYIIPNRTITFNGMTYTLYSPQMSMSISTNTLQAGTYNVTMSIGNTGCLCSKAIAYEPNPQIEYINIPTSMCEQTPFLFSVVPHVNNYQYLWDFGDGSFMEEDSIYHTYNYNDGASHTVTLTVTNLLGCTATITKHIDVRINHLYGASLSPTININVCPNVSREIQFSPAISNSEYQWLPDNVSNSVHTHNVYSTGLYSVRVYNPMAGCRAEATCNVGFYTAPWARIIGNTEYCLGETVELNGNTGTHNDYTWSISGPDSYTATGANLSYTPTLPGTYTAVLTVSTQDHHCSATATCTFTVNPKPATPTIAFGANHCIHEPPVDLHSTSGQTLLWSNGYHGTTAYSYTDGYLTAYYIDPSTGCHSDDAQIFIEPAPDFDALLTGCYKMCYDQFQYDLPVYGIYPYQSGSLNWDWVHHPTSTVYPVTVQDPLLPLIDFGNYYLDAAYTPGCTVRSPELIIEQVSYCPCDGASFKLNNFECKVSDCRLAYTFNYTIYNNGTQTLTFDDLQTNIGGNIISVNSLPVTIAPGSSGNIIVDFEYTDFMSSSIEFILIDHTHGCEVKYVEYVDWQSCITKDCGISDEWVDFDDYLSIAYNASYFYFGFNVLNALDVLSVWSKPSQVINFSSYSSNPVNVTGLQMLDYGILSQMAMNGESICFYVIACIDGESLCYDSICIKASDFLEKIPEEMRLFLDTATVDNDTTRSLLYSSFIPPTDKPYLAPNPARDEVTVMGIAPEEVAEITVLTMQGGQVADYRNNYRFNVSRLAKASYIVRVVTTDKQVYYLKLVKQ